MEIIIYGLFFVFGLFILYGVVKDIIKLVQSKNYTGQVEGTIVEVIEDHSVSKGRRHYYYVPVYEYIVHGQTYRKKAEIQSSDRDKYKVGEKAAIKYAEEEPNKFIPVGSEGKMIGQMVLMTFMGILSIALAVTQIMKMY